MLSKIAHTNGRCAICVITGVLLLLRAGNKGDGKGDKDDGKGDKPDPICVAAGAEVCSCASVHVGEGVPVRD